MSFSVVCDPDSARRILRAKVDIFNDTWIFFVDAEKHNERIFTVFTVH